MAHEHHDETHLMIHEVYYDEEGNPISCTENGVAVAGGSVKDIRWTLNRMKECCKEPILWYGDRFPETLKTKVQ